MRIAIAAALVAVLASTAGCSHERAADGGQAVSRDYRVGAFTALEVGGPYAVEVRTGPAVAVSVRGSEKLIERTTVKVEGDTLVIRPDRRDSWLRLGWSSREKARFVITVPALGSATIAGSGDIRIDKVRGAEFEGVVAGSGALKLDSVEVEMLKLAVAGSGEATARGTARKADYHIAGSGGVDAADVNTETLKLSIAGSGNVRAHAARTADIDIVGSGDALVAGGAKCTVSKAGSGNARCS